MKFDLGPLKGATSEVEESSNAHVRKQANLDGKAATIITPATTSNHIVRIFCFKIIFDCFIADVILMRTCEFLTLRLSVTPSNE